MQQLKAPLHFDLQTFQQSFVINQKEILGKGFDSVVYKVQRKDNNQYYALKLTSFKDLLHKYNFQMEIQLLHHIKHANIVEFFGNSIDGSCILIEYMPYGNLAQLVNCKLDLRLINCMMNEILLAVQYLHQRGVVHGDLKPENALISSNFTIKICDFGFAKILNQPNVRLQGGSEGYTAPEVLFPQEYDPKKVDIFAIGVFIFVMYLGYRPFLSTNPQKQDKFWNFIKNNQWDQFWKLFQGKQIDNGFKQFFQKLIAVEQQDRYNIDQVIEDEWFKKNKCSKNELTEKLKEIFKSK